MDNEFLIFILKLIIFFLILTPLISLLLMFSSKIFEKAMIKRSYAFIPIVNLSYLNRIAELPSKYLILYFIPIANLIYFYFVLYKLSIFFDTSKNFFIGLLLLTVVFLPMLSYGQYDYKIKEKKKAKLMEDVKDESLNLLTQEEIDEINKEETEKKQIDSLFKSASAEKASANVYRASKANVDNEFSEMEFFDDKTIKKVKQNRFITENKKEEEKEEKKDDIEILDL